MAAVKLSAKGVGSVVKIKVNGTLRNFIVVHQGKPSSIYDASCDGTWLLMEDIYETRQWHSSNVNDYANSTIRSYLNSTFLNLIDANIRAQIKQAKIPYRPGSGTSQSVNSGANGLSAKIFLLSDREVGYTQSNVNQYIVNDGAKLSYFQDGNGTTEKIAKLNGSATLWWLRSPHASGSAVAWSVYSGGDAYSYYCTRTYGVRPALILPSTLLVSDDGSVNTNTAPSTPGSITVPGSINGGDSITVSWGASSDAENNLEGYELERSVNGGSSWSNVYKGNARSTTNTVPFGTESVMYRVRAYDSQGLYSSYKTSNQVTVVNNNAPSAPASITVPVTVLGGAALTVTWGAASDSDGNLSGYALERQVDGGAWSEINRGTALSFNDTITKGWASVAYRVRAYDTAGAYSGYATSPARTVNNNTAPAITSSATNGSDLGVKNGGFTVSYSVSDADNDAVTVTETIDGAKKREFSATLGGSNSFAVTGETFMKLLNGKHTLSITANDGQATASHSVTFTKEVTGASITLDEPMTADAPITICVLSVIGFVPADAHFTVEVTNNALDDAPVWEDCTSEVKTGANHIFTNKTASKGAAFNFRITAERGASGEGGYITSVQGGFQ
ncbi:fibronectin type III domain-containing protein [Clostridiaceae bacterium]|nr:fibronectin type III domain-containing protein [Clostridiaceae bacterium]